MEKKITPLIVRVISAIAAAGILFSAGYFGGAWGLVIMSSIAIGLGIREYARIAFPRFGVPKLFSALFALASLILFLALLRWPEQGAVIFAVTISLYLAFSLWLTRNLMNNEALLAALGMGSLGLLYCVSLPVFAVNLLFLPSGRTWFAFLLFVVFFGDTFAFFGGRFFGRHKLMPQVSPNKTVEGAIAGLIGSTVAGLAFVQIFFPDIPLWRMILFCLSCGFVGQSGDLLMSLVKRVGAVKDSGSIMPGHGGILDRLDGIFLSAPLVYAFTIS
jgi:phosphatidate cytidylyltransferase